MNLTHENGMHSFSLFKHIGLKDILFALVILIGWIYSYAQLNLSLENKVNRVTVDKISEKIVINQQSIQYLSQRIETLMKNQSYQMRDIKDTLIRIENKLDKKADKNI